MNTITQHQNIINTSHDLQFLHHHPYCSPYIRCLNEYHSIYHQCR